MIKNKKAAIELSMGTIVIVVLAMSMLILGIVLVNKIFTGASSTVDDLGGKVKGEIANMFANDEGRHIAVKVGADKTIRVKQGTDSFGVAFGASRISPTNTPVTSSNFKYDIELLPATGSPSACDPALFKEGFIRPGPNSFTRSGSSFVSADNEFNDYESPKAYGLLSFSIDRNLNPCLQAIRITVKDRTVAGTQPSTASTTFYVQVIKGGIFN